MSTDDRKHLAARRVLLGALAVRDTLDLGPLRFRSLSAILAPAFDGDQVAALLSSYEAAGFIIGASSLQDDLPEPVYTITEAGLAEWGRLCSGEILREVGL